MYNRDCVQDACNSAIFMVSPQIYLWMFIVGYLLAYGTILAKMYRVFQIFSNPSPNKKVDSLLVETDHPICIIMSVSHTQGKRRMYYGIGRSSTALNSTETSILKLQSRVKMIPRRTKMV